MVAEGLSLRTNRAFAISRIRQPHVCSHASKQQVARIVRLVMPQRPRTLVPHLAVLVRCSAGRWLFGADTLGAQWPPAAGDRAFLLLQGRITRLGRVLKRIEAHSRVIQQVDDVSACQRAVAMADGIFIRTHIVCKSPLQKRCGLPFFPFFAMFVVLRCLFGLESKPCAQSKSWMACAGDWRDRGH